MKRENAEDILRLTMFKMQGLPYIWGGASFSVGFDCSGSILELLKSIGWWPSKEDTTAQGIYNHFTKGGAPADLVTLAQSDFGTLLFFGGSRSAITHVTMLFDEDVMFEFGGGGETTKTAADAIKAGACGRFRRVDSRKDLVACVSLRL